MEEINKKEEYIYSTQNGVDKIKQALKHVIDIEIPQNSKEIASARSQGDLRENFAYKIAKEQRLTLLSKMTELKTELSRVKIIKPEEVSTDKVNIGTEIKLQATNNKKEVYTILGPWDRDSKKKVISYLAPFAKALLGKKRGEKVLFEGKTYKILEISCAKMKN